MRPTDRARLTSALRDHVARIATDLRGKLRAEGRVRAKQLHSDEQVGEDFDVWTDLLSRRAAVLWVLKSVYVRVLEDKGLLSPGRILDPEAQQLFERLAPNLGESAFLRWVYRDLASHRGGLPELFAPQPAEIATPADEHSRALLAFWRHRDPDSGACWSFAAERFEGELMGDLYQELDPVVKDRFALCQTPDFVRAFILDRTLTPAMETFGADTVRLLDPACGSGHFLIDGLKRLVAATGEKHPEWDKEKLVRHCMNRVVGIDLNDYACALARARLVMTAAELAGVSSLAKASEFHPHVYWADGLEQVERGQDTRGQQLSLLGLASVEEPRAILTRPEVRAALKKVLEQKFHAVVANPPYILERDEARKAYHREKVGKTRRYVSASGKYSLGSPFTERCFHLAVHEGFVGLITGNNFMKRESGKPLIEDVLSKLDMTLIADTAHADIPFHATPTVLMFGRNRPPTTGVVRVVMGKRGETGAVHEPSNGRVWTSVLEGWQTVGFENEFVSVANVPFSTLAKHPWSLGGGAASDLKARIEATAPIHLGDIALSIGYTTICGEDQVFLGDAEVHRRRRVDHLAVPLVVGDIVRDFRLAAGEQVLFPYESLVGLALTPDNDDVRRAFWPYRTVLRNRLIFGQRPEQKGIFWYEHLYRDVPKLRTPLSIAFAFISTHNHFVLVRGGRVFKQTAPVIKLSVGTTEENHLSLLGCLNSSVACFWMKQVFHCKHQNFGFQPEEWMMRYEYDATKLKLMPIPPGSDETIPYARTLDYLAQQRTDRSVTSILRDANATVDAKTLRSRLDARRIADWADLTRMVAVQEELDWLCYRLYGIVSSIQVESVENVEPLPPPMLPWLIKLACDDAAAGNQSDSGGGRSELSTRWFERHGWQPTTEIPDSISQHTFNRIGERRELIRTTPGLAFLEKATYKRRWYHPDYEAEERIAMAAWLVERAEVMAQDRGRAFTVEQCNAALQDDKQVLAVAEILTGRQDFSLLQTLWNSFQKDTVPNHRFHVFKNSGLDKRIVWERTWEAQRREDAGDSALPENPPHYAQDDFLQSEYWQLRGSLDIPKERFIAFTEVPGRDASNTLYGWAGWTPLQRLKALLTIDEELEDAGVPLADRIGVLDSAWRLLPDVAREDTAAAGNLKAELQALVGPDGPSREQLDDWRQRFPPPGTKAARAAEKTAKKKKS